jgi:hypothetical protein
MTKTVADFPAREPAPVGTVTLTVTADQLRLLLEVFDKVAISGRKDAQIWASLIQGAEDAVSRLRDTNRG